MSECFQVNIAVTQTDFNTRPVTPDDETIIADALENNVEIAYLKEKELEILLSTIRNLEEEICKKKDKKFNKNEESVYDWFD
jgi:hypothetical protein